MSKYHLSPKTGNPGVCKAKYKCAFGDIETEHYDSKELAREAYEKKMYSSTLANVETPARIHIQSSEKFQELLEAYEKESTRNNIRSAQSSHSQVPARELRKSLLEANNSGDQYFKEDSISISSHPGALEVHATDAESGEEVYFYLNTDSGFAFYGDDPQGDAREDLTFQTVFAKIDDPHSVDSITECMLDLYEERESKAGKWESDPESIKFNYVNFGHFEVNAALRTGKLQSSEYRKAIDAMSQENTLEEPLTVYRGVPPGAAKAYLSSLKRGEGISDNALLSTTVDPRVAQNFARKDGLVFAIQLPVGQKCLDLSKEGNEGEILLPRGENFQNVQIFDTKVSDNA